MQVTRVDERDCGWEDLHPRFRVYLHSSGETTTAGRTETYDIKGADVLQVIDWAQRQAGEQLTYAVALVGDDADKERRNPGYGRGLVWLLGMDGNDTTELDSAERVVQQRMLARRESPRRDPPLRQGARGRGQPLHGRHREVGMATPVTSDKRQADGDRSARANANTLRQMGAHIDALFVACTYDVVSADLRCCYLM